MSVELPRPGGSPRDLPRMFPARTPHALGALSIRRGGPGGVRRGGSPGRRVPQPAGREPLPGPARKDPSSPRGYAGDGGPLVRLGGRGPDRRDAGADREGGRGPGAALGGPGRSRGGGGGDPAAR